MKTIRDFDLNNKKVLIRVDFNVPIKDNVILDDNRIVMSLDTIKYAIDNCAKIILLSHLGRIKSEEDKKKNSLKVVRDRLSKLLGMDVLFSPVTRGEKLENMISNMKKKEILLIEKTRYEDLDGKKESGNDPELGSYWASLGDIFINDAFGTSHRSHASNVGISSHLPSGIGFLMEKELNILTSVRDNPRTPYAVILGGAKVSDKIGVINNLIKKADYMIIAGGMCYTFLKAQGYDIGNSLLDEDSIEYCKGLLNKYNDKIILPTDNVVSKSIDDNNTIVTDINCIPSNMMGLDIGPRSIELFKSVLAKCKMVVWNGTVGYSEIKSFEAGTKRLLEYLSKSNCDTIICGGDTAAAAINFGYRDSFMHISTGGGASLELLEGKKLPGVEVID